MLALPGQQFGLDVLAAVGCMRMNDDFSFPRIHERLQQRGVPISCMTVQYMLRNYLSLLGGQLTKGPLLEKLKKQGAILPVIDGLQFGEGDPVLYLIIDSISNQPLFGQEMLCRGAAELVPFIAQIKELGLPILGVVSDKERALVPAIAEALPGVPHQLCQVHYVKNVAKPMDEDLAALGAEVRQTEEALRRLERSLILEQKKAVQTEVPAPADTGVTLALCQAARSQARRHGRALFDPPALKRHDGLELIANATAEAQRKKRGLGITSRS